MLKKFLFGLFVAVSCCVSAQEFKLVAQDPISVDEDLNVLVVKSETSTVYAPASSIKAVIVSVVEDEKGKTSEVTQIQFSFSAQFGEKDWKIFLGDKIIKPKDFLAMLRKIGWGKK